MGDDPNRTQPSNSIASGHVLALNCNHWHYSVVTHYSITAVSGRVGCAELGRRRFQRESTGWGGYRVVSYNF
ncbi:hypothetical protein ACNKHK_02110 [Shigella flexneri]